MSNEPKSFAEFADYALREILDGFVCSGTQGVRNKLYTILPYYLRWHAEQTAKIKEPK